MLSRRDRNGPKPMSIPDTGAPIQPDRRRNFDDAPVVVEARGICKTFNIPEHRITTFKERAVRPFSKTDYRQLRALEEVSFEIRRGEFFGIVGRNGSGKSTLLKILASIYGADAGTVRMAGRMAPFIELGVGFNPDLSAAENVVLNAVMMGLSPARARASVDAVFEFAELDEFRELQLKNYSSGMSVRLAFSVMLQANADILLIDEVLAVGDAAFQQKCFDVFREVRDSDQTVILVTHDMTAVQAFCDRAMLLHDGRMLEVGSAEEIGRSYVRINFDKENYEPVGDHRVTGDFHARIVDAALEDQEGNRTSNLEIGQPIRLRTVIEAMTNLDQPVFFLHCISVDGIHVFGIERPLIVDPGAPNEVPAGGRVEMVATLDNPLVAGRYELTCWVRRDRTPGDRAAQSMKLVDFAVYGVGENVAGLIAVDGKVEARLEERAG